MSPVYPVYWNNRRVIPHVRARKTARYPPRVCCPQGIEQDTDGRFVVRIIMEFCDRGDMEAAIARGAPFGAARVLSWTRHVLSALQFLHERKISHRDVKPANIMLCGADLVAKLGDLGLASSRDGNSTRSVAGTIAFMAPEMFSGTYGVQVRYPPLSLGT